MSVGWRDLDVELEAWAEAGRVATFWWRDDDATEPTTALDRLLELAVRTGTPVAVAVIPAEARPVLASRLASHPLATPLQHGWRHANHAPEGEKATELGLHRPLECVCADIARGRQRLNEVIGEAPLPCLVPPWNRIAPGVADRLPGLGFAGLSVFGPRSSANGNGLARFNCHIDPIDWRRTRGFSGEDRALGQVVGHLRARRERSVDPAEPTGLLTHHLAMDEACWAFTEKLLARTAECGARWLWAKDIMESIPRPDE